MEVMIIIMGIVLVGNFFYNIYSNRTIRKLIVSTKSHKLDDKSILDHIIYTRTSLNGIYTGIALITFVLGFWGYNVKKQFEQDMQTNLEAKGDTITKLTSEKVNEILSINLDTLRFKRDNIIEIESDIQKHKKKFDNIVSWRIVDSLNYALNSLHGEVTSYISSMTRKNQTYETSLSQQMDSRFSKVEKGVSYRWDDINSRISQIDDRVSKLEKSNTK